MKRFVIEAFNYFIKDYEENELMHEGYKQTRIEELNNVRNMYVSMLISEKEALNYIAKKIDFDEA